MLVTVFTPSYNRAYILNNLYRSLCRQSCKDFEWVVIDDGSEDNTFELLNKWKIEAPFKMIIEQQSNGGKHRAINRGVTLASGKLFFIVDSDDYLVENAIEIIKNVESKLGSSEFLGGICGLRCYPDGHRVGGDNNWNTLDCTPLDFRYKYKIRGDVAEVFFTKVLKEFPFPEVEGEKFCPESVVINRIATKYKFHYFYRCLYICEYLPDGLSAKIVKIRMTSPIASMICYSELYRYKIPIIQKIKAAINFWRFSFCSSKYSMFENMKAIGFLGSFLLPIGFMMHTIDKNNI